MNPENNPPSQPEPHLQPPIQYTMSDSPYPRSFFRSKLFFIALGVVVLLLLVIGISLLGSNASSKKNASPTPTLTLLPSITPTPIIYPTSYPDVTAAPTNSGVKQATPSTAASKTTSSTSPTHTPIPTPTPSTGIISGGYYDAGTHVPLTDARFAVSAQSDKSYARSDDKPTWSLRDLKPGHYVVSIDVDFSKYNQRDVTCSNCTLSNTTFGYTELDLKAGDSVQLSWTFDPK